MADPLSGGESSTALGNDSKEDHGHNIELQLKHGTFSTGNGPQQYVLVPAKVDLTKSLDIVRVVRRHWQLPQPKLLLQFQSGFAHPEHMLTDGDFKFQLLSMPGQQWTERHGTEPSTVGRSGQEESKENLEESLKKLKHKNKTSCKEVEELVTLIVKTASKANCWILVHGGPDGGSLFLERALKNCKQKPIVLVVDSYKSARYQPENEDNWERIINELRKKNPTPPEGDPPPLRLAGDEAMAAKSPAAEDSKQAEGIAKAAADMQQKEKDIKDIIQKTLQEGAQMFNQLEVNAEQIGKPAKPFSLNTQFWEPNGKTERWTIASSTHSGAEEIKWHRWLFRGGTHYLLTENTRFWHLSLDEIAHQGCIFLGGGGGTFEALDRMLRAGQPVIVIDKTGRVAQEFAFLHFWLLEKLLFEKLPKRDARKKAAKSSTNSGDAGAEGMDTSDPADLGGPTRTVGRNVRTAPVDLQRWMRDKQTYLLQGRLPQLETHQHEWKRMAKLKTCEDIIKYFENCKATLTLKADQIEALELLYNRVGFKICRSTVVLDPFDKREDRDFNIENQISLCLSNSSLIASDSTSRKADAEALKHAWSLHKHLDTTAKSEKRYSDRFTWLIMIISIASVGVSILHKDAQLSSKSSSIGSNTTDTTAMISDVDAVLKMAGAGDDEAILTAFLLLLPIFGSLLLGMNLRFRFGLRWSHTRSALQTLEAEIFRFRTRAGDYAVSGVGLNNSPELLPEYGDSMLRGRLQREDAARELFNARVKSCQGACMNEMGISSLKSGAFLCQLFRSCCLGRRPEHRSEVHPSADLEETSVSDNSDSSSNKNGMPCDDSCARWCCFRSKDLQNPLLPESPEDRLAPMSLDEYHQNRLSPFFEYLKHEAERLTFLSRCTETCVMLLSLMSAFLASQRRSDAVAMCIALYTGVQQLEKYHGLSQRLQSANTGVHEVSCVLTEWKSMEPLKRRFQSSLTKMVETTENAALNLINASTAGVKQLPGGNSAKD
eukprot:TRINITY_DN40748_c0_g1_i1.p1 TRINITY_DN40748_c0_g1~~TRINITY_DN40748_c0_g1_i1.p1  ORF type:complete len:1000 (+),score=133.22 TRINITY_DN40748_c0_g1_i1:102-3101(+)